MPAALRPGVTTAGMVAGARATAPNASTVDGATKEMCSGLPSATRSGGSPRSGAPPARTAAVASAAARPCQRAGSVAPSTGRQVPGSSGVVPAAGVVADVAEGGGGAEASATTSLTVTSPTTLNAPVSSLASSSRRIAHGPATHCGVGTTMVWRPGAEPADFEPQRVAEGVGAGQGERDRAAARSVAGEGQSEPAALPGRGLREGAAEVVDQPGQGRPREVRTPEGGGGQPGDVGDQEPERFPGRALRGPAVGGGRHRRRWTTAGRRTWPAVRRDRAGAPRRAGPRASTGRPGPRGRRRPRSRPGRRGRWRRPRRRPPRTCSARTRSSGRRAGGCPRAGGTAPGRR